MRGPPLGYMGYLVYQHKLGFMDRFKVSFHLATVTISATGVHVGSIEAPSEVISTCATHYTQLFHRFLETVISGRAHLTESLGRSPHPASTLDFCDYPPQIYCVEDALPAPL